LETWSADLRDFDSTTCSMPNACHGITVK